MAEQRILISFFFGVFGFISEDLKKFWWFFHDQT